MDKIEIWKHAEHYIISSINSDVIYNTYLKDAVPVSFDNNIFTLGVSLPTRKTIIEIRYKKIIENALAKVLGKSVFLKVILLMGENDFVIKEEKEETTLPKKEELIEENFSLDLSTKLKKANLNPRYTIENFVVGGNNQTAVGAAENIINSPSENTYNPLFIYGKSGLGKTHLIHAIGIEILKRNPSMKVLYVTSEEFTNNLITFLKEKNMDDFKAHYRNVDVLLIDDIQFIEGKEGTQEEFFHTFNYLHMYNKQIVITSDRRPKDLVNIQDRLINRFEWGLTMDIGLPDYETRVAILKKKAENLNIFIENEIFEYIAQRINSNVRELEGALSKIIAYAGISHKEIDIELAEFALASIIPDEIKLTPQAIIESVGDFYNITAEEIKGPSKVKELVVPRHVAMYLCKTLTDMNFVTIAKVFGNRDRTTVMHGVDKVMKNMQSDKSLKSEIEFITKELLPD